MTFWNDYPRVYDNDQMHDTFCNDFWGDTCNFGDHVNEGNCNNVSHGCKCFIFISNVHVWTCTSWTYSLERDVLVCFDDRLILSQGAMVCNFNIIYMYINSWHFLNVQGNLLTISCTYLKLRSLSLILLYFNDGAVVFAKMSEFKSIEN